MTTHRLPPSSDWFPLHLSISFICPPLSSVRRGKVFILKQGVGVARGYRVSLGESLSPFAYFYLPSTTSDDGADPNAEKLTTDSLELKHQSYVHQFLSSTQTHSLYSLPHCELMHSFGITTLCPQDCYIAAKWQVMATTYNGKNDILTSLTTRNEKNRTWTFLGFLCHLLCGKTSSRPLHCEWVMCRNYKIQQGSNPLTSLAISQEPNLTISRLSFPLATNPLTMVPPQVQTDPGDYI